MDPAAASETSWDDRLRRQKEPLLDEWNRRILDSYPAETVSFLKKERDRFANPVAHAFREAIEAIFQALVSGCDADPGALGYAMKIRALQGQDPREGVAFIYLLKDTVRAKLDGPISEKEWIDFESRIDRIAATALEMFVANRAKIAELAGRVKASAKRHRRQSHG